MATKWIPNARGTIASIGTTWLQVVSGDHKTGTDAVNVKIAGHNSGPGKGK
jgi:hypothetical protein